MKERRQTKDVLKAVLFSYLLWLCWTFPFGWIYWIFFKVFIWVRWFCHAKLCSVSLNLALWAWLVIFYFILVMFLIDSMWNLKLYLIIMLTVNMSKIILFLFFSFRYISLETCSSILTPAPISVPRILLV